MVLALLTRSWRYKFLPSYPNGERGSVKTLIYNGSFLLITLIFSVKEETWLSTEIKDGEEVRRVEGERRRRYETVV